jgi:hypothetical protein
MLTTLEGRLMWEKSRDGFLVVIPSRRSLTTIFYGPVVGIWLFFAAIHYRHWMDAPREQGSGIPPQFIAIAIYALGLCFAVCWVIWSFTNETVLTVNSAEFTIQRRALGIGLATQSYRLEEVHNLRFVHPTKWWASESETDPKTSVIQFRSDELTHSFAEGVTQSEAFALMQKMMEIHRFEGTKWIW